MPASLALANHIHVPEQNSTAFQLCTALHDRLRPMNSWLEPRAMHLHSNDSPYSPLAILLQRARRPPFTAWSFHRRRFFFFVASTPTHKIQAQTNSKTPSQTAITTTLVASRYQRMQRIYPPFPNDFVLCLALSPYSLSLLAFKLGRTASHTRTEYLTPVDYAQAVRVETEAPG